jgi:serine/threonine protein kinase
MSLAPGTRLGPYEVLAAIGAGGMGEVYRARDTRLGRDVAIKVLPEATTGPDRLARFEREARVLAALNHPHIGTIHGVEDADGIKALVLEFVAGETLYERLIKGPLPLVEAVDYARQIVDALAAAHEHGIVHRDLKPSNVKILPSGSLKVLDFGLAKAADDGASSDAAQSPTITIDATNQGTILGTAAYMSPEQARGQAVDKRTDIWAFGCVLYEMLAGRRAFEGEDSTVVIAHVIERDPDFARLPATTPPAIRTLLGRCLQKERKRRLADIADAAFDLDQATMSAELPAHAAGGFASPLRSREKLAWIAAAILLVTSGMLATLVSRGEPTDQPSVRLSVTPPPPAVLLTVRKGGGGLMVPAVSPDGRRVAFFAVHDGRQQLWVSPNVQMRPLRNVLKPARR